jgi:hypothetical protein
MKYVRQINSTTCGQACLAMLLNISIDESIALVGHSGITTKDDLLPLIENSFNTHWNIYPPICQYGTFLCLHKSPDNDNKHWTIIKNGLLWDPAKIDIDKVWPIDECWELNEISKEENE